jgi:PhnB protein
MHLRNQYAAAAEWYRSSYIINGTLVYVDDLQQHFENAKSMRASILSEPESNGPGLRYRTEDLEGQQWMFIQKDA